MRLHKRGEGHRGAVLAAAVLGTALAYMSDDMLNLAIPSVAQDLHASATGVQWILNAYDIPLVAFVLVAGSLGDVVGHRRMFTGGLLLFGSGAALCATAPDVGLLIAGRTLQGVAAAMLLAAGLALVTIANNPTHRRLRVRVFGQYLVVGTMPVTRGGSSAPGRASVAGGTWQAHASPCLIEVSHLAPTIRLTTA